MLPFGRADPGCIADQIAEGNKHVAERTRFGKRDGGPPGLAPRDGRVCSGFANGPSLGGFSLLRVQRLAALVRLIRREEGNLHG
jgi:hypothetical protein